MTTYRITPALLTGEQVADALGVSERQVRYWRAHGGGPAWLRLSERRIRYSADVVTAFLEASERCAS